MAGTFSVYEHYPIIGANNQDIGQTQVGDTCQLYDDVAMGRYHREYQGQWSEVCLKRGDGTVIDTCYIPSAAINLQ